MVQSFEYNNGTKIRLWLDELPAVLIGDSKSMDIQVQVSSIESWGNREIAIELSLQKHNNSYGLLGCVLIGFENKCNLKVEVHYNNKNDVLFNETLSYDKKAVFFNSTRRIC